MSAVAVPGSGYPLPTYGWHPPNAGISAAQRMFPGVASSAVSTMDLAGEKFAMQGRITLAGRTGSKTISSAGGKIHWQSGSGITFANGGTSLDIGIQDLTGNDPDGTFDVLATLVGGTDTINSTSMMTTAMESGSKSISHGQSIAIVWDMTARAGADVVTVAGHTAASAATPNPFTQQNLTGTWAPVTMLPNVMLEFDDGSFGWFTPFPLRTSINAAVTFNSGTAGFDEYGGRLNIISPVSVEAITIPVTFAGTSSTLEVCFYSDITGTPTLVATATTIDPAVMGTLTDGFTTLVLDAPVTLAVGVYGWSVRPTSANNITLNCADYGSNVRMGSLPMGIECYRIKRLNNTGAFTLEDTIHVPAVLHCSNVPNDASAGGSSGGQFIGG